MACSVPVASPAPACPSTASLRRVQSKLARLLRPRSPAMWPTPARICELYASHSSTRACYKYAIHSACCSVLQHPRHSLKCTASAWAIAEAETVWRRNRVFLQLAEIHHSLTHSTLPTIILHLHLHLHSFHVPQLLPCVWRGATCNSSLVTCHLSLGAWCVSISVPVSHTVSHVTQHIQTHSTHTHTHTHTAHTHTVHRHTAHRQTHGHTYMTYIHVMYVCMT